MNRYWEIVHMNQCGRDGSGVLAETDPDRITGEEERTLAKVTTIGLHRLAYLAFHDERFFGMLLGDRAGRPAPSVMRLSSIRRSSCT